MIKNTYIKFGYAVAVSALVLFGFVCQALGQDDAQVETPEAFLKIFYDNLLGDFPVTKCPEIFVNPESIAIDLPGPRKGSLKNKMSPSALIWEYLRDNKQLFLFSNMNPKETLQKAHVYYLFTGFPRGGNFFEGSLSIVLAAPLSKNGREGVLKEIVFPLEKQENSYVRRYLLRMMTVRVNGVFLDPWSRFDRSGNLYLQLGFPQKEKK